MQYFLGRTEEEKKYFGQPVTQPDLETALR
jgi:hypothetical protein